MTFFATCLYSKMQPISPNPRPLPNHGKTAITAQLRDTRQVIKVVKTETPSTAWHRAGAETDLLHVSLHHVEVKVMHACGFRFFKLLS